MIVHGMRMDVLGLSAYETGGFGYLYVAIYRFTKRIEVEPVRKVTAQSAIKSFRGLVCHFGVHNRIITDNDTQSTSGAFTAYYEQLGTQTRSVPVAHP